MKIRENHFTKVQSFVTTNNLEQSQSTIDPKIENYIPKRTDSQGMASIRNYSPNEVVSNSNINSNLPRLNSLSTPNWYLIPTKGMTILPNDELITQLKALAGQHTSYEELDPNNMQINKLLIRYTSSVSPDRKALYKEARHAIEKFESEKKEKLTPFGELTLVYFLMKMEGLIKDTDKVKLLSNGGTVSPIANSFGGYDYDVKAGGQTLLRSSNGKWQYDATPSEDQKTKEFYQMYWSFVDEANEN
ncbi:hypothetical protein ACIQZG_18980 [Lysinibacillus sp. NPDC096418]|uniref:hypothetical protein n=1 Tax=Lysinibacillus sp. NPDC096418 TaxID=3364138 RepID=UPI00382753E3